MEDSVKKENETEEEAAGVLRYKGKVCVYLYHLQRPVSESWFIENSDFVKPEMRESEFSITERDAT